MERKQQPGIMIYWDLFDIMDMLPEDTLKPLLRAMRNYALEGTESELPEPLPLLWPILRQRLQSDGERYDKIRNKNRIRGLVSHFKRNYAPEHGLDPEDNQALRDYLMERGIPEQEASSWTGVDRG